ncbi:ABC transporter permease [Thermococcus sp. JdF3]|uniref:ABC transporter permease n=1 Tax=Thermococcus sp. JdF3 TaxID=1638258 RepID=UPI001438E212|nr:ABC transporter permease [Thermococcus sp. JdF3]NJE00333.1 ABC transporter permease [Thermococcus sp. JdF3]
MKILRWELEDPLNLAVFAFGFLLIGTSLFLRGIRVSNHFMVSPPSEDLIRTFSWRAMGISVPLLSDEVYTAFMLTAVLLSSLVLRNDRDTRFALSLYSLPVERKRLVLSKVLAVFIVLFTASFLPFILTVTYIFGDTGNFLLTAFLSKGLLPLYLLYWALAVLYAVAVSSLVALISPNTFVSIMAGLALLYVPYSLGASSLPPAVLNTAIFHAYTSGVSPSGWLSELVSSAFLSCVLLPVFLIALALYLAERRDVR